MVALGGATPGCPRVGIRYSRYPSPTSTWGAATSRHAAVAIILTPSAFRRRIAPATFRILLYRPPSPPLPLTLAVKERERERKRVPFHFKKAHNHHYHPNPPRNHRPPHQPSSPPRTTTNYHAPPSRVILVKVNESKVSTEHLL